MPRDAFAERYIRSSHLLQPVVQYRWVIKKLRFLVNKCVTIFDRFLSSSILDVCEVVLCCIVFRCFCRFGQVLVFARLTDSFVIIYRLNVRCDLSLNFRPIVIEE